MRNADYKPGDIALITDHINLTGISPTRGKNIKEFGERFFDMTHAYDSELLNIAQECAEKSNLKVHKGIYQFFTGPQFETPAEIRVARLLGADLVGMSTIPEVITAVQCGFKVLGISLVTNMAAGVTDTLVNGDDVTQTSNNCAVKVGEFIKNIIEKIN